MLNYPFHILSTVIAQTSELHCQRTNGTAPPLTLSSWLINYKYVPVCRNVPCRDEGYATRRGQGGGEPMVGDETIISSPASSMFVPKSILFTYATPTINKINRPSPSWTHPSKFYSISKIKMYTSNCDKPSQRLHLPSWKWYLWHSYPLLSSSLSPTCLRFLFQPIRVPQPALLMTYTRPPILSTSVPPFLAPFHFPILRFHCFVISPSSSSIFSAMSIPPFSFHFAIFIPPLPFFQLLFSSICILFLHSSPPSFE